MTTEQNKKSYSRSKARKIMNQIYLKDKLPRDLIVHHKDLNPFNNDRSNLEFRDNREHLSYHWKLHPETMGRKPDLKGLLQTLDSLLTIYNTL